MLRAGFGRIFNLNHKFRAAITSKSASKETLISYRILLLTSSLRRKLLARVWRTSDDWRFETFRWRLSRRNSVHLRVIVKVPARRCQVSVSRKRHRRTASLFQCNHSFCSVSETRRENSVTSATADPCRHKSTSVQLPQPHRRHARINRKRSAYKRGERVNSFVRTSASWIDCRWLPNFGASLTAVCWTYSICHL